MFIIEYFYRILLIARKGISSLQLQRELGMKSFPCLHQNLYIVRDVTTCFFEFAFLLVYCLSIPHPYGMMPNMHIRF